MWLQGSQTACGAIVLFTNIECILRPAARIGRTSHAAMDGAVGISPREAEFLQLMQPQKLIQSSAIGKTGNIDIASQAANERAENKLQQTG